METRRQLLKSASMLAAVAVAPPTVLAARQPEDCEFYASKLCDSLSRKYGGNWNFQMTTMNNIMLLCKNS
ncbi:hypothetical protein EV129_11343 [Rhizobium azibense]|uniref:Secreted protein n=1 Tax=Rhizobium azibense TaxID=1136135 RepID=A0A4R3REU5_9HYPH|nr:hypothetical protein EV129_11343 [Rhizobium azibense]